MSTTVRRFETRLQVGPAISGGNKLFAARSGLWIGTMAIVGVVFFGMSMAFSFAFQFLFARMLRSMGVTMFVTINQITQNLVFQPLLMLVAGVLLYPLYRQMVRELDGRPVSFATLFGPEWFRIGNGLANVSEHLLQAIPTTLIGIPMGVAMTAAQQSGNIWGGMAVIAPFLALQMIVWLGIAPFFQFFAFLYVEEPQAGILQCLKWSFQGAVKNYWPLLGLTCVSYLCMGLGVLLCGVGLVVTIPWGLCMLAAGYRQVVQSSQADAVAAREQAWEDADRGQEDAYQDDGSWDQGRK